MGFSYYKSKLARISCPGCRKIDCKNCYSFRCKLLECKVSKWIMFYWFYHWQCNLTRSHRFGNSNCCIPVVRSMHMLLVHQQQQIILIIDYYRVFYCENQSCKRMNSEEMYSGCTMIHIQMNSISHCTNPYQTIWRTLGLR